MFNMPLVRLTYRVMPHLTISETAGKEKRIRPIWMWESAVINIKKKKKHSSKQTMSITSF